MISSPVLESYWKWKGEALYEINILSSTEPQ